MKTTSFRYCAREQYVFKAGRMYINHSFQGRECIVLCTEDDEDNLIGVIVHDLVEKVGLKLCTSSREWREFHGQVILEN